MRGGRLRLALLLTLQAYVASKTPKALLINLPRHTDRLRDVKLQLDSAGIAFERAEAVDGKALSPAELAEIVYFDKPFISPSA